MADEARVRHLLHVFSTFAPAGPQVRTVAIIRALGADYRHSIVAMDDRTDALELLEGAAVRVIPAPRQRGTLARVRALRALFASERPDLVLTYNWGSFDAVLAARSADAPPHVHHEDGFNADEAHRLKLRRTLLRRFGLRRARRVVVVSSVLEGIAREKWKLPAERVQWIPNGIDVEHFAPGSSESAVRATLAIPAGDLVVGTVGHLRPVKCLPRLVEALARVDHERVGRSVHLLVVGDGPERARLEALARERHPPGGSVHFVGHQTDLRPYYAAMDVFALSSDSEQLPVSLLEAMATELPVVSTDVGDVRRVVPIEQARFVVPVESPARPQALARALTDLLLDPASRTDLGRNNRRRVAASYSFATMLRAYTDLYEEAASPVRSAPVPSAT